MRRSSPSGIRNSAGEKSPTVRLHTGVPPATSARISAAMPRMAEPRSADAMRETRVHAGTSVEPSAHHAPRAQPPGDLDPGHDEAVLEVKDPHARDRVRPHG